MICHQIRIGGMMSIEGFEVLVKSEKSALRFLKKLLWKNYVKFCMRCGSRRVYSLGW